MFNPICLKSTPFALYLALGALGGSTLAACGSDDFLPPQATLLDSASASVSATSVKPVNSMLPVGSASVPVGSSMSNLANSCVDDTDCGSGMYCLGPDSKDFLGGGPAGGYCTAKCKSGADCTKLEANSICTKLSDTASICLLRCVAGPDDALDVKCQGRSDLACDANPDNPSPICRPLCGADADCGGNGRRCDLSVGVCVQDDVKADPIGKGCTNSTECESGFCLKSSSQPVGFCSGYCNFVASSACGVADATTLKPGEPTCLYPAGNSAGPRDLGYCGQTCACDGDCKSDAYKCLLDPTLAGLGVPGYCVRANIAPADLDPDTTLGKACSAPVLDSGVDDADASQDVMMSVDSGDMSVTSAELPAASSVLTSSSSSEPSASTPPSATSVSVATASSTTASATSASPGPSASVAASSPDSASASATTSAAAAPSASATTSATAATSASAAPSGTQ